MYGSMPEPRHSSASKGDNIQRPANDYKSTGDCPRRTEREQKDHTGSADDRHGGSGSSGQYASRLREGDTRSGTLTSLPTDKIRTGASNRHDVPAIAILPSPSSEAGKLVSLDLSRPSFSSGSTPRLSPSTSPRARTQKPPEIVAASGPDSSRNMSPKNVSPRLPAMKSPPSPRNDESILSMPSIGGPHSKRRVRSLSPKKNSCIDHMEPIHPDKIGTRASGQYSILLDAKEEGSRRGERSSGGENAGEGKCGRDGIPGGHGRLVGPLQCSGGFAEAKSEAKDARTSRPGSCSPLRSSRGTLEGIRRAHRLEMDEPAAEMPRSGRPSYQESLSGGRLASLGDSYGRGDKSERTIASSSTPRGQESATSPRTRRIRPERDSGT